MSDLFASGVANRPNVMAAASADRTLRICHLAYTFYENDNRVIRYAEEMSQRGHEVEVIALRRSGQARHGFCRGVHVSRIQRRAVDETRPLDYLLKILWFFIQSFTLLGFRHSRKPYDVVHVHNVPDFLVFAALIPKLCGSAVILDIHDILPELYGGKFGAQPASTLVRSLLFVERMSCLFADHVIVANHLWYDKLCSRAVPRARCTTMLNYPDLRLFRPIAADQKRRDAKFVFMYPGTLNHHQGVDLAIRAFARVQQQMPEAEFHIYGEGPDRRLLADLIVDCHLERRVILKNRLPIEEIAPVMATADAGVVPKRAEGFGNEAFSTKILEFMASAVPVIVSRTQVDSYYFDETLVRFFTSGSEQDLADALVDLYCDRDSRTATTEQAMKFAVQHSWQERGVDYQRLIGSLSSRYRSAPLRN